jgi:hypothetical protein
MVGLIPPVSSVVSRKRRLVRACVVPVVPPTNPAWVPAVSFHPVYGLGIVLDHGFSNALCYKVQVVRGLVRGGMR